jgi:hypothetical protein
MFIASRNQVDADEFGAVTLTTGISSALPPT